MKTKATRKPAASKKTVSARTKKVAPAAPKTRPVRRSFSAAQIAFNPYRYEDKPLTAARRTNVAGMLLELQPLPRALTGYGCEMLQAVRHQGQCLGYLRTRQYTGSARTVTDTLSADKTVARAGEDLAWLVQRSRRIEVIETSRPGMSCGW